MSLYTYTPVKYWLLSRPVKYACTFFTGVDTASPTVAGMDARALAAVHRAREKRRVETRRDEVGRVAVFR